MKKHSFLVKSVLMSMLTVATYFGFTSCQDDVLDPDMAPQVETIATTRAPQATGFNLNDHYAKRGSDEFKPFNRKQWWSQNSVFLYTGAGGQDIKAWEGLAYYTRSGYELQNLPWSGNGGPCSYIPQAIIEDLQNDKDNWQLVLLQCGSDATKNGNYLGFYHKYRGILRILTYLKPGQLNKTNHMWGFSMNDALASHSVFGYALPEDKVGSIGNIKQALNMRDWMNKTVTPMMNKSTWDSANGTIPANEGWWAFDIDLSVYNSTEDVTESDPSKKLLGLHPLGYEESSFDFGSDMQAIAKGNVKMEQYQASDDGDIVGSIMKGLDVISKIAELAGNCAEGKVAEAISGGVDLAKTGCEIAGFGSETTGYQGDIHLDMSGTITTKGKQSKTVNFDEMPAVDLKLADFDFKGNTLGQGVWNLETAPVVYCTNAETNWKEEKNCNRDAYYSYIHMATCRYTQVFGPVQSPFGGLAGSDKLSGKPWHGLVCFFDPSSVKVTLNPQLFSDTEIQRAKVTAVCGVRKGTDFSRYELHRTAQRLQGVKRHVNDTYQYPNRYTGDVPFNAYGRGVSKFSTVPVDKSETGCIGAGDSLYLVEPVSLRGQSDTKWGDYYLPAYEVTVTVTIELDNGKTLVLSRSYLPEFKDIDAMQVESYYNKLKNGTIGMPAHYQQNVYNGQVERIGQLNRWFRTTPIATHGTPRELRTYDYETGSDICCTYEDHPLCTFSQLIDGDKTTKWASHVNNKYGKGVDYSFSKTVEKNCDHNCWFAEFKTYAKAKAKGFTLTCSNTGDNKKPRSIRLFARNDNQGEWVQLYYQNNIQMPSGPNTEMTFNISSNVQGNYNTYRFEVVDNCGGLGLDLNELTMNWAE